MNNQWISPNHPPIEYDFLPHIPSCLHPLFKNRLMEDQNSIQDFLDLSLKHLHSPMTMLGMEEALSYFCEQYHKKEALLIYGDYDVDGITSIALLSHFFTLIEAKHSYYLPHRIKEGYGLNEAGLNKAHEQGFRHIITVDCGIRAIAPVEYAKKLGIQVIITDHHEPGDELPKAKALLNPKQKGCPYPNKALSGVGVAFKFAHGVLSKLDFSPSRRQQVLKDLLAFVAVGTIADVVPLLGENRRMVAYGLKAMEKTPFAGLQTLVRENKINFPITSEDIAFKISPRLNASGRTEHGKWSAALLTEDDPNQCLKIYQKIDQFNQERKEIQKKDFNTAKDLVEKSPPTLETPLIILYSPDFHLGVNGIVASKLVEQYHRPALVFAKDPEKGIKGSARSIPEFNIYKCICQASDHIDQFGGHPYAAGISLKSDNFKRFATVIQGYAQKALDWKALTPQLRIENDLSFSEINLHLWEKLYLFQPFGESNPTPLFRTSSVRLIEAPKILNQLHLKFKVEENGVHLDAIGFFLADTHKKILASGQHYDLLYHLSLNHWRGEKNLQLLIKDIRRSHS